MRCLFYLHQLTHLMLINLCI